MENDEINELQSKIKVLEDKNLQLLEKNQDDLVEWKSKEQLYNVRLQIEEYNRKINELTFQMQQIQVKLQNANAQLMDKDQSYAISELDQQRKELNLKQEEVRDLMLKLNASQSLLAQESNEKDQLRVENERLKSNKEQLRIEIQQVQEESQEIRNKSNLNEQRLNFEIEKLGEKYQKLQGEQSKWEKSRSDLQSKLINNRKDISEKLMKLEEYEQLIGQLRQKIVEQEQEIEDLKEQLQEYLNRYKEEMSKMIDITEQQNNQLKTERVRLSQGINESDQKHQEIQKQYYQLQQQNEKDKERLLNQIQHLQKQLNMYKKGQLDLEYQLQETTKEKVDKLKQYTKLLESISKYDEELKQLINQNRQKDEKLALKEQDIKKSTQLRNQLLMQIQQLKYKLDSSQNQIKSLKSSLVADLNAKLKDKDNEIALMKEIIQSNASTFKTKDKDIQRLKIRIKTLEQQNVTLIGRYQNLEVITQKSLTPMQSPPQQKRIQKQIELQNKSLLVPDTQYLESNLLPRVRYNQSSLLLAGAKPQRFQKIQKISRGTNSIKTYEESDSQGLGFTKPKQDQNYQDQY